MSERPKSIWLANFWGRLIAYFLDILLLGLLGLVSGFILEDFYIQLGSKGKIIGFTVTLLYFGLMDSRLFDGQTPGKKLLNLRVVNAENQTISLGRSVLRCFIFTLPLSLSWVQLSSKATYSFLMYPLSVIAFGGFMSLVYLYLFNRKTRQSIHDLIVGSYVIKANAELQNIGKIWKGHLIVVAVLFFVAVLAMAASARLMKRDSFKDMFSVLPVLMSEQGVSNAAIVAGTQTLKTINDGIKTTEYISVTVLLASNQIDDVELARHFARLLVKKYPEISDEKVLSITLKYGYDIGIHSTMRHHTYNFHPAEIRQVLQPARPTPLFPQDKNVGELPLDSTVQTE